MVRRLASLLVLIMLVVVVAAGPAAADHGDRRRHEGPRRVEIRGHVTGVDPYAHVFHVRSLSHFEGGIVRVYVDGRTDFEFKRRRHEDFDLDERGLRFLRVGDAVEVEGRAIGRRAILAREVEVVRRHRDGLGSRHSGPIVVVPQPVVVYPRPATIVAGPRFILIGRAPIGSRVVVQVIAVFGSSVVRKVSYDAYADQTGQFTVPIHTATPGAEHRITTWSVQDGMWSVPAVLVVYGR